MSRCSIAAADCGQSAVHIGRTVCVETKQACSWCRHAAWIALACAPGMSPSPAPPLTWWHEQLVGQCCTMHPKHQRCTRRHLHLVLEVQVARLHDGQVVQHAAVAAVGRLGAHPAAGQRQELAPSFTRAQCHQVRGQRAECAWAYHIKSTDTRAGCRRVINTRAGCTCACLIHFQLATIVKET
jgi:hypothetical protein